METFDFEPDLGLKLGQTKPQISSTVPTNRPTAVPNESVPISACFGDNPKLLNCGIAQPRPRGGLGAPKFGRKHLVFDLLPLSPSPSPINPFKRALIGSLKGPQVERRSQGLGPCKQSSRVRRLPLRGFTLDGV